MSDVLKLEFFDRRVNTESEHGTHLRMNLNNGNTRLSPGVAKALNVSEGDKVGFAYLGGKAYVAKREGGLKLGKGFTTTTGTHAIEMKELFKGKIKEGHTSIILSVDVTAPIAAEDKGKPTTAFELKFSESLALQKKAKSTSSGIKASGTKKA